MSGTIGAPLMFVPQPGEGSVQGLFQRLEETAKAAIAERESNTGETFAQDTFRRAMHRTIDVVAGPEDQQRSVGIAWLSHGKNRTLFRQAIPVEECTTFFKAHLTNKLIVGMLEDHGTLCLIPERDRTEFVRAVLGSWIPVTDGWIKSCLSGQISRQALVDAIMYWLRQPESFPDGDVFAARFLRTGTGAAQLSNDIWTLSRDYVGLWTLFTELEDIWEALDICAERAPAVFFERAAEGDAPNSRKVQVWLKNDNDSQKVLQRAIINLKSRHGLSTVAFSCLTKPLQLAVIRRPEICPLPLLVKFALDYVDTDGFAQFQTYVGQVTRHCADYAADLLESFTYMSQAQETKGGAPYVTARIGRIRATLLRYAPMHHVNLSELEL